MIRRTPALLGLIVGLTSLTSSAGDNHARAIERFAKETIERLGSPPGMALAVVRGDEVIYAGGVGYRDGDRRHRVDADTGFYIASSTKSFVALAAALLAERGVVDLDRPITDYLTDLELPPERPATLRQLLTHTSGLESEALGIRTAYTGDHSPAVLRRLLAASAVRPTEFDYSNFGYVVASLVLDEVTHGSWKELVREEILAPLGMRRTTAYVSRAADWPLAEAHMGTPDGPRPIPFVKRDSTMHAAGGLVSTARDLSTWLLTQLNDGRLGDRQVFPAAVIGETQRRQAECEQKFFAFERTGYGLGWYHSDYDGELLLHHFGAFAGFRAHVSFMPEHGIGVVALINESGHGFFVPDLVAMYVYDRLLDKQPVDKRFEMKIDDYAKQMKQRRDRQRAHARERSERTWTLTRPVAAYTGTFRNEALGEAVIARRGDALTARIGVLSAVLEPFTREDTARLELVPGNGEVLAFDVAADGSVRGFTNSDVYWARAR